MNTKEKRAQVRKAVDALLLSEGATLTNQAVADRTGSSPSTVHRRRQALGVPTAQRIHGDPSHSTVRRRREALSPVQSSKQSRSIVSEARAVELQRLLDQESWSLEIGGGTTISWTPTEGLTSSPPLVARAIMALVRQYQPNTDLIQKDAYNALELVLRVLALKSLTGELL